MSKGFLYDEGDELITRKEDVGGLPDTSEASTGDVLSLDSDKSPVWSAPSGGGETYLTAKVTNEGKASFYYPDDYGFETPIPFSELPKSFIVGGKGLICSVITVDNETSEEEYINGAVVETSTTGIAVYLIDVENPTANQTAFDVDFRSLGFDSPDSPDSPD